MTADAGSPGSPAPPAPVAPAGLPGSVGGLTAVLRDGGYLADRGLATTLFVALSLRRPVLLEGEVGVGKTEAAKVLASVFGRRLIRLQCYEGIDTSQALYEWDYARQMLHIRALSGHQLAGDEAVEKLFGPKFLLERPLLAAVRAGDRAVLLIDEVDRADDEFEAFLLEELSGFQVTIPGVGTIRAESPARAATAASTTRPGRTTGSASTRRRPRARSPPAARTARRPGPPRAARWLMSRSMTGPSPDAGDCWNLGQGAPLAGCQVLLVLAQRPYPGAKGGGLVAGPNLRARESRHNPIDMAPLLQGGHKRPQARDQGSLSRTSHRALCKTPLPQVPDLRRCAREAGLCISLIGPDKRLPFHSVSRALYFPALFP